MTAGPRRLEQSSVSQVTAGKSPALLKSRLYPLYWGWGELIIEDPYGFSKVFPVAQIIKNLLTVQETWVRPLGQEDPLEKGMAPHSSTLAWRVPWTEEPGGLQSIGWQRVGHD